MSIHGNM
jgi:ditrans,polycis-polyprenyl diphosphate synthase